MLHQLLNTMRQQADMAGGARAMVRHGIVSGYDPGSYCAKVRVMPEDRETGWLPIVSPWIGNGWGLFAPPSIGDAVEVQFQEDDAEAGYVCQRFFNDSDRPLSVQSGEFWLVHKSGAFFKLTNDGKALINGQVEIDATAPTINITATGNITAQAGGNATVQASGNAMVQAGGSATIKAASIALQNAGAALKNLLNSLFADWAKTHVHSNGNGGANTGVPTTTPGASTQTSIVQAE